MEHRSPAECLTLLQRLDPTRVDDTHAALNAIVGALLVTQPAPNQHLEVLEAARALLAEVQAASARRYAGQPLPPDSNENATLLRVVALWRNVACSYALIAQRDAAHGTLSDQRALLAQRRQFYAGQGLIEYFRAHRTVPGGQWADVHDAFAAAEASGTAHIRVADPLNEVWKAQSAVEAYAATLLADLANPYGRSGPELLWVCRWAQRFAPYCSLSAIADADKPTVYGIDLAADHGLRPLGLLPPSTALRRFDGSRLASQIQAVFNQLKQGVSPASLGLGKDCPADTAARLLLSLYRPWGLAAAGRRFPRRGCNGEVALCGDWLGIGFHVQGRLFTQPQRYTSTPSFNSDIALLTFGERADAGGPPFAAPALHRRDAEELGFVCGHWTVVDQSVGGFRLTHAPRAERLEHHQLVGLRPQDGERFLLGQISWLMFHGDGVLEAGVHILPGLPRVVAARALALQTGNREPYQQAFLLPPTPALKVGASLVLPAGWFSPSHVLEIDDGGTVAQVRLTQLVLKGANFDQVSFEVIFPSAA